MFIKETKYLARRAAHWDSLNYLYMVEIQFEKFLFPLSTWLCCKVRIETTCQEVGMRSHHCCWPLGWFLTQVSKQLCDKTTLYLLLIFPSFPPRSGQVWLQFVYRFWRVFMDVGKIAVPMANLTFCQKIRKIRFFPVLTWALWGMTSNPSLYISQAWLKWHIALGGSQAWCQPRGTWWS